MACSSRHIFRTLIITAIVMILACGCAWENIPPGEGEANRIWEIRMVMEGSIDLSTYYFIVFNISGDPAQLPVADFDGLDRGRNWDFYYVYGKPGADPFSGFADPLDFYKGEGGGTAVTGGELPIETDPKKRRKDPQKPASTQNKLDTKPTLLSDKIEFLNAGITSSPIIDGGSPIANNTIFLRLNFKELPAFPAIVNMNMIVSSLGIDVLSNDPNDDYEALVWDSFEGKGISLRIHEHKEFREGEGFTVEVTDGFVPNKTPSKNIISWSVELVE